MSDDGITKDELKIYPAKVHEFLGGDITAASELMQEFSHAGHRQNDPELLHVFQENVPPV